jgi:hypothetical protein
LESISGPQRKAVARGAAGFRHGCGTPISYHADCPVSISAQESVAPVAEESACAGNATNKLNPCNQAGLRNSRRDALASEGRHEEQF